MHRSIQPNSVGVNAINACSIYLRRKLHKMSMAYRKGLFGILFLLLIYIGLKRMCSRNTIGNSFKNATMYYNRYCIRHYSAKNEYGYVSAIRQMRWIRKTSEKPRVTEKDGPLIYYDKVFFWPNLYTDDCQYHCRFSMNFSDYRKAALAVFLRNPLPETLPKPDNQTWALASGESPFHRPWIAEHLRKHFKVFLLPNGEAQVPWIDGVFVAKKQPEAIIPPHEQIRMLDEDNTRWLPEQHAQRKKKAVALISNMNPQNKRLVYVKELAQHIDVDFYGSKWLPCPREGDTCLRTLALQYKFFLAFENSNCVHYITEKLFTNALQFGMLPVVMGAPREDYCALAPPNSFIHVDDFSSPAELADYLHWLDTNDAAYASYFAWKAHGNVVTNTMIQCRLCGFVHQHLNELTSIPTQGFDYFANISRQCTVF